MTTFRRLAPGALAIVLVAVGLRGVGAATDVATPYSPTGTYANGALLPSGRLVHPAGSVMRVGDFPAAVAVSPRGDVAVVSNAGQGEGSPEQGNETLSVVDLGADRVVQSVADHAANQDTFYNEGVAFSPDGRHLYATGGGNDRVYDYAVTRGRLRLSKTWPSTRRAGGPEVTDVGDQYGFPRNLAVSPDGKRVYVSNEQGGSVAGLDPATGSIVWESQLPGQTEAAGAYPAGIAVDPKGANVYVVSQGQNLLYSIDAATGAVEGATPVGDHPVAVALSGDGNVAFVANDNDDSLTVLDLTGVLPSKAAQLSIHLFRGEANGSAPNAIAVDERRKLVYVADAGDDAVAVVGQRLSGPPAAWDPSALHVLGFLPTAWYPTAVAVSPRDGSVLAASAKGNGGVPVTNRAEYDGNDMVGLLGHLAPPDAQAVGSGRVQALHDLEFATRQGPPRPPDSPIPDAAHAGHSPIKHVVLVVRENRTFDQVFGDLSRKRVDADPAYVEFGRRDAKRRTVTPNAHDIARRFAISDNFYSDGEASVQGHYWTALGVTPDYVEKSWLQYYSNRNHPYDPTGPVAYPRCGSIFQQLALSGKTFRNFGELEGVSTTQAPALPAPDASCSVPGGAADAVSVANEDATAGNNLTLTTIKDTARLAELEKVYAPLVATDNVPDLSYVIMGNDHTGGSDFGKTTPQAQVATNDLAVGGLVDYLSHTPQWPSTAVFVMEDDSQDGLDHRDGHRNILMVASPFVKPGDVSHLHISQASILHTIELILGLPPLSSYTQTAPVPYEMFSATPDLRPYAAETPTYPLDATNPSPVYGTPAAVRVDVSAVDLGGPALEAQLWWATNPGKPMPTMLLDELAARGGITPAALKAWGAGKPCACRPLLPGLRVAPGFGGPD